MDEFVCNMNLSVLISTCKENTSFISVKTKEKINDYHWDILEEDDDHLFLKNNNNEVLFVKKGKK